MLYGPNGNVIAGLDSGSGAVVELISLDKFENCWRVWAAVDGKKLPQPFYEPCANVEHLDEDALMSHLKEQAVGLADYYNGAAAGA